MRVTAKPSSFNQWSKWRRSFTRCPGPFKQRSLIAHLSAMNASRRLATAMFTTHVFKPRYKSKSLRWKGVYIYQEVLAHLFLQTTTLGTTCKLGYMIGTRNHSRVFHDLQTQHGRQDAAIQCNSVSQCRFQSQGYPGACKTYEVVWWVWTYVCFFDSLGLVGCRCCRAGAPCIQRTHRHEPTPQSR